MEQIKYNLMNIISDIHTEMAHCEYGSEAYKKFSNMLSRMEWSISDIINLTTPIEEE